ncbi:MAG: CoA transferase, partial [bacterium]|nr:CoA transferase [bacterium]
ACAGHHVSDNPQWLALSVASETQWNALVAWLGRPTWATRIGSDLSARRAAEDDIDRALSDAFATRELAACLEELVAVGVPAAAVHDPRALALHPQFIARGFFDEVEHTVVGRQATMGPPFRYASVSHWLKHAAPTLGQHNREILRELGYDEEKIEGLEAREVIGDWPQGV